MPNRNIYMFTAKWCAPCQIVKKKIFTDLRVKSEIKKFFKLYYTDTDKYPNAAQKWRIKTLPTIIVTELTNDIDLYCGSWQPIVSLRTPKGLEKNILSFLKFLQQRRPEKP